MYLEGADAVHLVAEEIDAIRQFAREGKDVDDAATHSKLAWLIHIVGAMEAEGKQRLLHEHDIHLFAHAQIQRLLAELLLRDDQFGKSLRVGDDV